MLTPQQTLWEQIFGFLNPLQTSASKINPIEDGKAYRIRWRKLSDRIIDIMRQRLASTYNSYIPSSLYDDVIRGWAEEIARVWLEGDRVKNDRILDKTRGEYLFQKWGYMLHVGNTTFPRPTYTTEVYRTLLKNLLIMYIGGPPLDHH